MSFDGLFTAEEVADRLGGDVKASTVTSARLAGELTGVRLSRRWLYHPDAIDAWIRSQTTLAAATAKPTIGTARAASRKSRPS